MATTLPAPSVPAIGEGGAFNTSWRRFLEGLWRRTGAGRDISLSVVSDTSVRVSLIGTDGVTRTVDLTLS